MTTSAPSPSLGPHAVLVLETVLARGVSPAETVAISARLDRPEFEHAVDELVGAGLIRVTAPTPGTVRLHPGPQREVRAFVAAGGFVPAAGRRLMQSRRTLDRMITPDRAQAGITRIDNISELVERLEDACAAARVDILSVHADPAPSAEMLEQSLPDDLAVLGRGVALRSVSPASHLGLPHVRRYAVAAAEHGAQIRFAESTPHRIVVIDGRSAFVPLNYARTQDGALLVQETALVRSLQFLGLSLFRRAREISEFGATDGYTPTAIDRRVLTLMNSGVTDRTAARQIGVTDRQFRRYVSHVLEQLGAASRFQAGVKAVERGWL